MANVVLVSSQTIALREISTRGSSHGGKCYFFEPLHYGKCHFFNHHRIADFIFKMISLKQMIILKPSHNDKYPIQIISQW